ncbi:uncharacterized protein ARMOST_21967 [Armillaria ostoyae]|uniref:RNA polymerase III subunit Rpc25 domain-containing protein n=1 Tax=Armillaria ostoyae TaxID=47428 RepID=A0A284SBN0_ARMOS|nr:uncharacterized protein ARMOST_21967 [Armillaria ostoyae]
MAKGLMEASVLDRELIHRHPLQLASPHSNDGILRRYIYIPSTYLPKPSAFDCAFFWVPDSELTTSTELLDIDVASRMYIEVVRVRVEADEFHDDEPGPPKMTEEVQVKQRRAPYQIICSMAKLGLGNVSWWNASREEDAEGDAV